MEEVFQLGGGEQILFGDELGLLFAAGVTFVLARLALAASGKRASSSEA